MGKLTDDMTRLVDEIHTMDESRCNFIKGIQNAVKQEADETRQFIKEVRNNLSVGSKMWLNKRLMRQGSFLRSSETKWMAHTKPSSARRVLLEETLTQEKNSSRRNVIAMQSD